MFGMYSGPYTLFTFRRKGRNYKALRRQYWYGVNKPFGYNYLRKAYKKARWRRAERRAAKEWGILR